MGSFCFHISTFGCQMNVNDSFWLTKSLKHKGFLESSLDKAHVVILNTCSVREKPEQKVYNMLNRIWHTTKGNSKTFVVVAGCVAQQIGSKFFDRFPQVRIISGSDGIAMLPEAIERICLDPEIKLDLTAFAEVYPERASIPISLGAEKYKSPIAYVNIMQGCDNYCAYCIVPYTRGHQKSRALEAILEECRTYLNAGVKEIMLLGQNVNAYGLDIGKNISTKESMFTHLLRQVASLQGLKRLRFITPHPKDFSEDTASLFAELPMLSPRVHLPLQSGSDRVLERMGRQYSMKQYAAIVSNLRSYVPDIAFSSDFIVGFPGETEEDFLQTLEAIDEIGFISSFSFCYSDRPGTTAMQFSEKIPAEVKIERLTRLQEKQGECSLNWLEQQVGKKTDILLENRSSKGDISSYSWQARDPWGNVVYVPFSHDKDVSGTMVSVKIVMAKKRSLVAELL